MKDLSLAFESSCDDTSIAILSQNKILFEKTISQNKIVEKYGGIFPEIIARDHLDNFIFLFEKLDNLIPGWKERVRRISYTFKPGFIGSLVIGKCIAKTFALSLFNTSKALAINELAEVYDFERICLVKINHLDGHIYSAFLLKKPSYPFIAAVISGGHTHIYLVKEFNTKVLVAKTRDDSIGEAYDKLGRMYGIAYPWGQNIDKLVGSSLKNVRNYLELKSPLLNDGSFSFSGIKTKLATHYAKKQKMSKAEIKKCLAQFQKISQEAIYQRIINLTKEYKIKYVAFGGGVASNSYLRKLFKGNKKLICYFPDPKYCVDNAAMIGNVTWQALNEIKKRRANNL